MGYPIPIISDRVNQKDSTETASVNSPILASPVRAERSRTDWERRGGGRGGAGRPGSGDEAARHDPTGDVQCGSSSVLHGEHVGADAGAVELGAGRCPWETDYRETTHTHAPADPIFTHP